MSIIVSERIDWFFWQRDKQVQGDKGHYQGTKKSRQRKSAHGNRHESSLWREKYKKRIIECQDVISLYFVFWHCDFLFPQENPFL